MERTEEIEDQVRRLTHTVDEMRARMAALEAGEPKQQNGSAPSSRRGFLRLGAAAALGAVGWTAAKVIPAAAATGGNFILGNPNLADMPTTIQTTGTAARVLGAEAVGFTQTNLDSAGTFTGPLQGLGTTTGVIEGVDGWAQGPQAFGVYGLTDGGTGVVGEAATGIGLYARRSGRIRQDPQVAAGAPTYNPNLFEQVRDAGGVMWVHGTTGVAPAVWRRVNTLRTDTADGLGSAFKPLRLVDTRNTGGPAGNGVVRSYTAAPAGTGASSIPADAIAVVGNLTAVGFSPAGGFLAIVPKGVAYNPNTDPSSLNFSTGAYAWANSFVCGLGTGANAGQLSVFVSCFSGTTNFIIDITGYIQ